MDTLAPTMVEIMSVPFSVCIPVMPASARGCPRPTASFPHELWKPPPVPWECSTGWLPASPKQFSLGTYLAGAILDLENQHAHHTCRLCGYGNHRALP